VVVLFWVAAGCDECKTSADCSPGEACIDGECSGSVWNGPDADTDTDTDADTDTDTDTDADPPQPEWVEIPGGDFMMGSDSAEASSDEGPVHAVSVSTFEITRTEITVEQYRVCVVDEACEPPTVDDQRGNWGVAGRAKYAVNYVTWEQAGAFCEWAGGRLPSEAEWEYAARSAGQELTYPWGEDEPSCDYCVMALGETMGGVGYEMGCGEGTSLLPCAKSAGNTDHGLCDMSGGMFEWVADSWHADYTGAPTDGSAWEEPFDYHVIRGASYQSVASNRKLATTGRDASDYYDPDLGFRCARDVEPEDPDGGVDGGVDGGGGDPDGGMDGGLDGGK
jgi:formylglycine-generating enzyme required for sulfatase activity